MGRRVGRENARLRERLRRRSHSTRKITSLPAVCAGIVPVKMPSAGRRSPSRPSSCIGTSVKAVVGSTRQRTVAEPMPSGSLTRAKTRDRRTGRRQQRAVRQHRVIAGPALATARLFGAPGVPRFVGTSSAAERFEIAALQPQDQFADGLAASALARQIVPVVFGSEPRGDRRMDPVAIGIAIAARRGAAAPHSPPTPSPLTTDERDWFPCGGPAEDAGLEPAVDTRIRSGNASDHRRDRHLVDQRLALSHEEELHPIRAGERAVAEIERAGRAHRRPRRLGAFIAVGPGARERAVGPKIGHFEARSSAGRPAAASGRGLDSSPYRPRHQ